MTRPSEFQATLEPLTSLYESKIPGLGGPGQDFSSLPKRTNDQPVLINYDINLVKGNSNTFFCDAGIPDYWVIGIRAIASVQVSIFTGTQASGVPYRISGGGSIRIPALSEYITVLNESGSTNTAVGTVIAVRGYKDVWFDPGNIA